MVITCPFLLIFTLLFWTIQNYYSAIVFTIYSALLVFVFVLNKRRRFGLAKRIVLPAISSLIAGSLIVFGREPDAHVLILTMMIFVFIFYDRKIEWVVFGLVVYLSFFVPFVFLEFHDPFLDTDDLPYSHFLTMSFALLACSLLSYEIIKALKAYLLQKDQALQTVEYKNDDLRLKSIQIEKQRDELKLFTTLASHDLKSPIRIISSFLGLLKNDSSIQNDRALEYLEFAQNGVRQLTKIVDGISYLQSFEDIEEMQPNTNIENCIESIKADINPSNSPSIEITYGNIPNLKIKYNHAFHLLKNIIENAVTFNTSNTKKVHIYQSIIEEKLEISIADNGIGIDPQFADAIFKPFQKLHADSEYKSTGLGLAISAKIIGLYKGDIKLQNSNQRGSIFCISIPKALVWDET